jgi:hypothetical protein
LTDGELDAVEAAYSEDERWIAFRRGRVLLAANLSNEARSIASSMLPATTDAPFERSRVLLTTSDRNAWRAAQGDGAVELAPGGAMIVDLGDGER